jgi:hypothetical protein
LLGMSQVSLLRCNGAMVQRFIYNRRFGRRSETTK